MFCQVGRPRASQELVAGASTSMQLISSAFVNAFSALFAGSRVRRWRRGALAGEVGCAARPGSRRGELAARTLACDFIRVSRSTSRCLAPPVHRLTGSTSCGATASTPSELASRPRSHSRRPIRRSARPCGALIESPLSPRSRRSTPCRSPRPSSSDTRAEARQLMDEYAARNRTGKPSRLTGTARKPQHRQVKEARSSPGRMQRRFSQSSGHRVIEEWMGEEVVTLAGLLRHGLQAVVVGINPSPVSVAAGHYNHGKSGQRFFAYLTRAGFAPSRRRL